MNNNNFALFQTSEDAVSWMLNHGMIEKSTTKNPETLAPVRGFVLSAQFGRSIGANLLELFAKATGKKRNGLSYLTVHDTFLMATMAANARGTHEPLSQDEIGICANILMTLLPVRRLATAGVVNETLRHIANSKTLVRKIQRACGI